MTHSCWLSVPCSPTTARAGEPTAVAAAAACHPPTDGSSSVQDTHHRPPNPACHVTRQRARIGPTDAGVTRSGGVAAPCVRRHGNCYVMASREEEGVGSRGRPLAGAAALREGLVGLAVAELAVGGFRDTNWTRAPVQALPILLSFPRRRNSSALEEEEWNFIRSS